MEIKTKLEKEQYKEVKEKMKQGVSFHDNPVAFSQDYNENAEIHRFLNQGFEISQELISNLDHCEAALLQIKEVANLCQILVQLDQEYVQQSFDSINKLMKLLQLSVQNL